MKRIFKIVGAAIGALLILIVITIAVLLGPFFWGRMAIADGFEINGIRILQDGITSVAVLSLGQGRVALIDAGQDTSGRAILAELSRRNLGTNAVVAILITHGHPDHIGAIHLFPNANIMSLENEVGVVEGRVGARGPAQRLMPARPTGVKVTSPLKDGETITLGQTEIQVFAVPGHTAGHAAYLVNGVLFLGDAAYAASDGQLRQAVWIFSDSQTENRTSLAHLNQRLLQDGADVKAIACAHSGTLTTGLAPLTAFAQGQ
jgi:glyoxylase-like metal-dependent hydrolase (beta-lactamase superfamily II)